MSEVAAIESANSVDPASRLSFGSPLSKGRVAATDSETTVSFGDFVDMINPLQHIPVISALYRDASGDEISPMARIGGDALYGAALGPVSAGISAMLAIADEAFAANNDGQSAPTAVVAGLFGTDEVTTGTAAKTQIAAADAAQQKDTAEAASNAAAALPIKVSSVPHEKHMTAAQQKQQAEANMQSALQIMNNNGGSTLDAQKLSNAASQGATTQVAAKLEASRLNSDQTSIAAGMPLDRSKLPYGGVMDTSMMQNALQNQSAALALAAGQNKLKNEHALRNARLSGASAPLSSAQTAPASTTAGNIEPAINSDIIKPRPAPATNTVSDNSTTGGQTRGSDPIPQALINDLMAMRGLSQYRSTAQSLPMGGQTSESLN